MKTLISKIKNYARQLFIFAITTNIFLHSTPSVGYDLISLGGCFKEETEKSSDNCFIGVKEVFTEKDYVFLVIFPIFFAILLNENTPSSFNTAQLSEMGYTADEIADFAKDMNTLQSEMIQRNLKFTSASEAKAWIQTLPLAPITRELMRRN